MADLPFDLIERQHGLVTTEQLQATGVMFQEERWLVESKRFERVSPRLLRLLGAPRVQAQRLMAAVLDAGPGSALSHTTAMAWWGVPGFTFDLIHVTHTRDGVHRPRRLADRVHDKVVLPEHHVRILDGIPVVTPPRALFDLAGMPRANRLKVERAVDNAWSQSLVSGFTLRAMLNELGRRGRPGITMMREILEARGVDYVPPASGLEGRVVQILADCGPRPLRRQIDCGDESGWIGRVDFVAQDVPFVLEVQSERFHASRLDQQSDAERVGRLEAAGFVVATVTDIDVWQRPDRVVEVVRQGRWAARSKLRAATA